MEAWAAVGVGEGDGDGAGSGMGGEGSGIVMGRNAEVCCWFGAGRCGTWMDGYCMWDKAGGSGSEK